MDKVLILDTSFASLNKGDDIIMECVYEEMEFLTKDKFILNLPTHLQPFSSFQVFRNSRRVRAYSECEHKLVGGSNLLIQDMLTHFPQWNLNFLTFSPLKGCVLVGVGAGVGKKVNYYTKKLYNKMLSKEIHHSVRDERTKKVLESIGIEAINTGCITMWKLTEEFCKTIPETKGSNCVFTLTSTIKGDPRDQIIINSLLESYDNLYFWPQGMEDTDYLRRFENIKSINILQPTLGDFKKTLMLDDMDYVGTRLHAGVYAMRHQIRSIIIAIDERARAINADTNLNCIEKVEVDGLSDMINSEFKTEIHMPFDKIDQWRKQFNV